MPHYSSSEQHGNSTYILPAVVATTTPPPFSVAQSDKKRANRVTKKGGVTKKDKRGGEMGHKLLHAILKVELNLTSPHSPQWQPLECAHGQSVPCNHSVDYALNQKKNQQIPPPLDYGGKPQEWHKLCWTGHNIIRTYPLNAGAPGSLQFKCHFSCTFLHNLIQK